MSDWYWRVIALKAAFALSFLVCSLRADDTVQKLPFCNPNNSKDGPVYDDLVIISTLDGRLSAFSTQNGMKAWDLETQPLLSSNLHHVELTSGGKWVRLVPSLSGTLYSLSGENIEPLPFDAEQLLSSSFKYSDDLVIAGARETLWFGVDAHTGGVIYECGSAGCTSEQQTAGAGRDVLVLRRHSNTVRALDPRTGTEKWNFSVAEHRVALSRRECAGAAGPTASVAVRVAMPEGIVAIRDGGGNKLLWQQKLDSPVAGMWRLHAGTLQNIDVLWEATKTLVQGGLSRPSLYIGVHDRQLYIQESELYAHKLETAVSSQPLPWKLVSARPQLSEAEHADTALSLAEHNALSLAEHNALSLAEQNALSVSEAQNALALITSYGNTGNTGGDQGFFVYLQETCSSPQSEPPGSPESPGPPGQEQHHIHVHISSLWYWWKEVLLIALSSALLLNLMIWPRVFVPRGRAPTPLPHTQEQVVVQVWQEKPTNIPEYSGRYENDFTPLRLLGRGGFGVVFEARNNIDHWNYAVKRITLPKKESKRERVLREVRALAKLEHEHIVRYFNAWVEQPPPHWQKQRDMMWIKDLEGASLVTSDEYTATSPTPMKSPKDVKLNLNKCTDSLDQLDYEKQLSEPSKRRTRSCNDSFSIVFDSHASGDVTTRTPQPSEEDSYIVFAHSQCGGPGGAPAGTGGDNSLDKRLERVKQCDYKTESSRSGKKKRGHTRHWSLDLCVSPSREDAPQMYLYIQMQLCRRDSLHDWLRENTACHDRPEKAKVLFSQIVSAVEYVHLAGLIHRDLKPSNILFAPDGRVKVGDFGLVTAMGEASCDGDLPPPGEPGDAHQRHTYRVGTHLYMSPEQLRGRPYSYKVDIYSLGLILFELLQPFGTEAERVHCITRLRGGHFPTKFHDTYPNEMEVLKLMLSEEPSSRPTATGVRARAPLYQATDEMHHFTLPPIMTS